MTAVILMVCRKILYQLYEDEGKMPCVHDIITLRRWTKTAAKQAGVKLLITHSMMYCIWKQTRKILKWHGQQRTEYLEGSCKIWVNRDFEALEFTSPSKLNEKPQPPTPHNHVAAVDISTDGLHPQPPTPHNHVAAVDISTDGLHPQPPTPHNHVAAVDISTDGLHPQPPTPHNHVAAVDISTDGLHPQPPTPHNHVAAVDISTDGLHPQPPTPHNHVAAVDISTDGLHPQPPTPHNHVAAVDISTDGLHPQPPYNQVAAVDISTDGLQPPILHGHLIARVAFTDNPPAQLPTPHNQLGDTTIDDVHPRSHGLEMSVNSQLLEIHVPVAPHLSMVHSSLVSPPEIFPQAPYLLPFLSLSEPIFCDIEHLQPTCDIPLQESS